MKFIFLDIDGVLNNHTKTVTGYGRIQSEPVEHLNDLLKYIPDAQLVITSAWRYIVHRKDMTLKGFEYLLLINGILCENRVHGVTLPDPDAEISHLDKNGWTVRGLTWRTNQIKQYLVDWNCVNPWVCFDDLPLQGLPNFVQINPEHGIQGYDVIKAIEILSRKY